MNRPGMLRWALAKGYGVRSIATKALVDANTLFGIVSNTKAFTTAALGLLVDEGKLRWDDKVTDYIPEFKLYDPYATAAFTAVNNFIEDQYLGLPAHDPVAEMVERMKGYGGG